MTERELLKSQGYRVPLHYTVCLLTHSGVCAPDLLSRVSVEVFLLAGRDQNARGCLVRFSSAALSDVVEDSQAARSAGTVIDFM